MADINSVTLVGRLTRDAEIRSTQSGTSLAKFSLAINRYAGKDKGEEVSFIDCTLWGKQADAVGKYLEKGKQIGVVGELVQERWEKDGQKHSKVTVTVRNVQLLGGKGESGGKDDFEDDMPF